MHILVSLKTVVIKLINLHLPDTQLQHRHNDTEVNILAFTTASLSPEVMKLIMLQTESFELKLHT